MYLKEIGSDCVDWIRVAQHTDRWRALVEYSNEYSGHIKDGEFIVWLSDCQLLKKDSAT
jgi:hypothetical protein